MATEQDSMTRVMALHALAYCERLFYLEEVEEIRVADDRVYAGRALHEDLNLADGETSQGFELSSDSLRLVGKFDAIHHREGGWVVYEHKRGRSYKTADGTHQAWSSDALQASAYAMLLEEHLGTSIAESRVRYHTDNVTVRVPLDDAARASVHAALARADELRTSVERPPVTPNENLCIKCSLAPVCLPEEERLARDESWETVRLFPPRLDGTVIHVTEPGARVGRTGEMLKVTLTDGSAQTFPVREAQALLIHGYGQVTTQALHLCAANCISVHWLTGAGDYVAGFAAGAGPVQRRIRQFEALANEDTRLELARRLAHARVESQLRYLLRATRGRGERSESIETALRTMRTALKDVGHASSADTLRGHEGMAGKAYFSAVPQLLSQDTPPEMVPAGRSRRPPRDRFNALLGFGYALLQRSVLQAILAVGLEPAFGFYHTPRSNAHPLVLDLMELFRVPIWDMALVGSVNRRHWDPEADFDVTKGRVWLSQQGRRKAITLFERRLNELCRHPVTGYSLSYARTIELEVRLLEKEWTGQPGLFARARLR